MQDDLFYIYVTVQEGIGSTVVVNAEISTNGDTNVFNNSDSDVTSELLTYPPKSKEFRIF